MLDGRLRDIPAQVKQEYEDRAIERVVACNEEFLSHTFEVCFCVRCAEMAIMSSTRSRREFFTFKEIVLRRVCCQCGYTLRNRRTAVRSR